MKAVLVLLFCTFLVASALPAGFQSPDELASVLANEPAAASSARFAETSMGDSITFKNSPTTVVASNNNGGGCGCQNTPSLSQQCDCSDAIDDDTSEFDAQIEQINKDLKNLEQAIKETEECAKRLREQQAEKKALKEQKEHLEKEKEKKILQAKLERQMRDLSEINRMSRSLRSKFNELKHTQKLIKTKMIGTRSSLNNLDSDAEVDFDSLSDGADLITKQMSAMHKAQSAILSSAQTRNEAKVKDHIETSNKVHGVTLAEEAKANK